ncbi:MAG: hypothetical protein AAGD43_02475 [Pseudomonadota bacterium]
MTGSVHSLVTSNVEVGEIPFYPEELVQAEVNSHYFMLFWHDVYLQSRLHMTADLDVEAAALRCFFYAQKRRPLGTLPVDEGELATLLRLPLSTWRGLMKREMKPLHKWSHYRVADEDSGEEIVWGHADVIRGALHVLNKQGMRAARSSNDAARQRRRRLPDHLARAGVPDAMMSNNEFLDDCHRWLEANFQGKREGGRWEAALKRLLREAGISTTKQVPPG